LNLKYEDKFNGINIYQGNCLEVLKEIPDSTVNCCVTSPPYWSLRDYGVDGQLGLEKTPNEYVVKMVEIFREVRRVLKDDGTLWLNLGDSYVSAATGSLGNHTGAKHGFGANHAHMREGSKRPSKTNFGLPEKNLCGIPWKVAFALQEDGWYLRQDIIWHKPNPMPESVTDRCTKSHEYIFLMTKSSKYYYDSEAIGEPLATEPHNSGFKFHPDRISGPNDRGGNSQWEDPDRVWCKAGFRNKRSVWSVPTHPFPEAHFATFPIKLIEPCILAGCPKDGVVLDPFLGSGTTLLVAMNLGRKGVGIELKDDYIKIAIKRIDVGILG